MKKRRKTLLGTVGIIAASHAHAGLIYNDVSNDLGNDITAAHQLDSQTSRVNGGFGGGDDVDTASIAVPSASEPLFLDFSYQSPTGTTSSNSGLVTRNSGFISDIWFSVNGGVETLLPLNQGVSSSGGDTEGAAMETEGDSEGSAVELAFLNFYNDTDQLIFGFEFEANDNIFIALHSDFSQLTDLTFSLSNSFNKQTTSTYSLDIDSSLTANAVPEPATLGLVATGLAGLYGAGWRRRKSKNSQGK